MRQAMVGLRVVWCVLMLVLLYLIVSGSITPLGLVFYSLVVIAVMSAAMYLRPRGGRRAAR